MMNFSNAIKDFVYDNNYYISLYGNNLHIFRYEKLNKLTDEEIIISFKDFNLIINGINLLIVKMNNDELLIEGNILSVIKK